MENLSPMIKAVVFAPLLGALIAGLFGKLIGRVGAHVVTIALMCVATVLSSFILYELLSNQAVMLNETLFIWGTVGNLKIQLGFLIDRLSGLMMFIVTLVSLLVHLYSIGYMREDDGYQRFFSYISFFTFAMLMLVTSNNFLQLFFGWEGVGLASYLLIGFWFTRESAVCANLKAFLVNRVGDFGFLLGIAGVALYCNSLDYQQVFSLVPGMLNQQIYIWPAIDVICICLFIGAMGKSAQVPLHVWLPDSMEGPTPISALIHAATMVTAGVFMVARMSPLFEFSEAALNVVLIIGAITCFFTGLIAVVQTDIKRIVAYSTLSQLGYMVVALGASAYAAGIFHLATHAFFKALLFLGAGSVIIAMHHAQDIRKMGNLKKYMPITYGTMLIGSLALVGFPGTAGFYSKDLIIETVALSQLPAAKIAYYAVLFSVFVTALYTFRMFFLVFHTQERMDLHTRDHLTESPWVVWLPLVVLAIFSLLSGAAFIQLVLGNFFSNAMFVTAEHDVVNQFAKGFHGAWKMLLHGFLTAPFWLMLAGIFTAWYCYVKNPKLGVTLKQKLKIVHSILMQKYGFDEFYQTVIVASIRNAGWFFWQLGDIWIIDKMAVNGTAKQVANLSQLLKKLQTGYIYHYAFAMIGGLCLLLFWLA